MYGLKNSHLIWANPLILFWNCSGLHTRIPLSEWKLRCAAFQVFLTPGTVWLISFCCSTSVTKNSAFSQTILIPVAFLLAIPTYQCHDPNFLSSFLLNLNLIMFHQLCYISSKRNHFAIIHLRLYIFEKCLFLHTSRSSDTEFISKCKISWRISGRKFAFNILINCFFIIGISIWSINRAISS